MELQESIEIRRMQKRDISAVYEIECICFRSPWSKLSLLSELRNDVACYLVLTVDDRIVGYGGMWTLYDEAHVTNIAVLPEYRRRGFAKKMLLSLMAWAIQRGAEKMTLEVRETNAGAQQIYAGLGFLQQGRRPRYYDDTGEAALLLWNENIKATVASCGKMW